MTLDHLIVDGEIKEDLYNRILDILSKNGIVILENYYNEETLVQLIREFDNAFLQYSDKIDILDKEDCSKDERIFYAEKYSPIMKNIVADDQLFEKVVSGYTKVNRRNKKTLINKIEHKEGEVRNSGAGWHRDNHDCQFKVIMYLSDVNERNGNFQFLTNSSKKHIGYPTPRTTSYNTRFADETVNDLITDDNKILNITGKLGTILIVDTTYIHRGNIIKEGERKAITQYYF